MMPVDPKRPDFIVLTGTVLTGGVRIQITDTKSAGHEKSILAEKPNPRVVGNQRMDRLLLLTDTYATTNMADNTSLNTGSTVGTSGAQGSDNRADQSRREQDRVVEVIRAKVYSYRKSMIRPADYPKENMFPDLRVVVDRCYELQQENARLQEVNSKLIENLKRFGAEPKEVFARPGSLEEELAINRRTG